MTQPHQSSFGKTWKTREDITDCSCFLVTPECPSLAERHSDVSDRADEDITDARGARQIWHGYPALNAALNTDRKVARFLVYATFSSVLKLEELQLSHICYKI